MLNILDIPDQYFFVWDRARHEAIEYALAAIEELRKTDTEKGRADLKEQITPVFGFRMAEKLHQKGLPVIEEALKEKEERQRHLKRHLEDRFQAAARKAAELYPTDFDETEVRRDAVFYTAARSGLMAISDALGYGLDWECVSGEISSGQRLDRYLPQELVRDVVALLPHAVLFNKHRDELFSRLKSYGLSEEKLAEVRRALPDPTDLDKLGLHEEQRCEVEGLLEKCAKGESEFSEEFGRLSERLHLDDEHSKELKNKLKKVVKGSAFGLAKSLNGLQQGRVDENVLARTYRCVSARLFIPLGAEAAALGRWEYNISHVHVQKLRQTNMLKVYFHGREGIPQNLMRFVQLDETSKWAGSAYRALLDPILRPGAETLGLYIGHFLFGHGSEKQNQVAYCSGQSKGREWFLDLLEKIGKLEIDPSKQGRNNQDIARQFGREQDYRGTSEIYTIPQHFVVLAYYGLEQSRQKEEPQIAKAALFGLFCDRFCKDKRGGHVNLKLEYEDDIRRMAYLLGLSMSKGSMEGNKLRVHIKNYEIVGYNPNSQS